MPPSITSLAPLLVAFIPADFAVAAQQVHVLQNSGTDQQQYIPGFACILSSLVCKGDMIWSSS